MLEYMVIPTFDLVIEYGSQGIIIVKGKIPPYRGGWALPGLRMVKPENIDDTIRRVGKEELGLVVNPLARIFLGQYVGRFQTEHHRQDLSTGYYLRVSEAQPIHLNTNHFSSYKIVKSSPTRMGAMYSYYVQQYLLLKEIEQNVQN